jgi:hypothetical protein
MNLDLLFFLALVAALLSALAICSGYLGPSEEEYKQTQAKGSYFAWQRLKAELAKDIEDAAKWGKQNISKEATYYYPVVVDDTWLKQIQQQLAQQYDLLMRYTVDYKDGYIGGDLERHIKIEIDLVPKNYSKNVHIRM